MVAAPVCHRILLPSPMSRRVWGMSIRTLARMADGRPREVLGGSGAILDVELARAEAAGRAGRSVVLVEGASDQRAVEVLADRRGRSLDREGVEVIATAGVSNLPRFLGLLGPDGHGVPLAGLCDSPETPRVQRALEEVGMVGSDAPLESAGFFVCVVDLEDELIRTMGTDRMLGLIESQGHRRRFHSFQNQPAQRGKSLHAQIRRWLGNYKIRYAPLMVGALDPGEAPPPMANLLAYIGDVNSAR